MLIRNITRKPIIPKKIKIYCPEYTGYNKPIQRKYDTGILLITNTEDSENLKTWLKWHLDILEFDCIVIIDNDAKIDIKQIIKLYKNRVIYKKISGKISQYEIYNDFLNNNNLINWLLFIDDDEFLYISDKYNNKISNILNDYKNYYKLSINSLIMRTQEPINNNINFITDAIYAIPLDFVENKLIKTMVNCNIGHLFTDSTIYPTLNNNIQIPTDLLEYYSEDDYDIIGTPHNPVSHDGKNIIFSKNISTGIIDVGLNTRKLFTDLNNIDVCLLHYKYNTIKNWHKKINNTFKDINATYFERVYNDDYYNLVYRLPATKFLKPYNILKKYDY